MPPRARLLRGAALREAMAEPRAKGAPKIAKLATHAVDGLGLSKAVEAPLRDVVEELDSAYRDRFLELAEAIKKQASALDRIQRTLELLVKHADPELLDQAIPAIRLAERGESPDVATVVVDPIAAGYALSQQQIADALQILQSDVSVLLRAFDIKNDPKCAVVVRRGPTKQGGQARESVNYHRRVVDELRRLIESPPPGLSRQVEGAIKRARKRLTKT